MEKLIWYAFKIITNQYNSKDEGKDKFLSQIFFSAQNRGNYFQIASGIAVAVAVQRR